MFDGLVRIYEHTHTLLLFCGPTFVDRFDCGNHFEMLQKRTITGCLLASIYRMMAPTTFMSLMNNQQPTTKKKRNVSYIYTMIKCVSCFFPYSLLITCHLTLDLAQLELSESSNVHLGDKQNDYHLQCN